MRFRRLGIYKQMLILFISVVIIPIVIFVCICLISISGQQVSNTEALVSQWVSSISTQLGSLYTGVEFSTLRLSKDADVEAFVEQQKLSAYERFEVVSGFGDGAEIKTLLSMSPYINSVYIIAGNGDFYVKYRMDTWKFGDETSSEFVKRLESTQIEGDYGIMIRIADMRDQQHMNQLVLVRRVNSSEDMRHAGMIAVVLDFSEMQKQIRLAFSDEVGLCVVSRDMLALCTNADWEKQDVLGMSEGYTVGDSGSFSVNVNDADYFMSYKRELASGWRVMLALPEVYVRSGMADAQRVFIYVALITIALASALFFFFVRSITKPIVLIGKALEGFTPESAQPMPFRECSQEINTLALCYNSMVSRVAELVEKMMEAERQKRIYEVDINRAQLQALQMQINPHFLYNTLSVMNTYALLEHQQQISQMIETLGVMLRYALQNPLELTPVANEIQHVRDFLKILGFRMADMPKVVWHTPSQCDFLVMRMTLQPLVENAFQHAFSPRQHDRRVDISIRSEDGTVLVEVADNGNGIVDCPERFAPDSPKVADAMGIGLNNVHRRAQILFGPGYGITVDNHVGQGTSVLVRLPYVRSE